MITNHLHHDDGHHKQHNYVTQKCQIADLVGTFLHKKCQGCVKKFHTTKPIHALFGSSLLFLSWFARQSLVILPFHLAKDLSLLMKYVGEILPITNKLLQEFGYDKETFQILTDQHNVSQTPCSGTFTVLMIPHISHPHDFKISLLIVMTKNLIIDVKTPGDISCGQFWNSCGHFWNPVVAPPIRPFSYDWGIPWGKPVLCN